MSLIPSCRRSLAVLATRLGGSWVRLWSATIEAHRRDVRDAILGTTAALVGEQGLRSVTMSQIAVVSSVR